jgi:hypothetical protein
MQRGIRRLAEEVSLREKPPAREGDFWTGKTPCWEMCYCPPAIRDECPAFNDRLIPCWETEGTFCKLKKEADGAVTGTDTTICETCRVHRIYGDVKPVELKFSGKGFGIA